MINLDFLSLTSCEFKTGDGLEKAIAIAVCWKNRYPHKVRLKLKVKKNDVELFLDDCIYKFQTDKGLDKYITL